MEPGSQGKDGATRDLAGEKDIEELILKNKTDGNE